MAQQYLPRQRGPRAVGPPFFAALQPAQQGLVGISPYSQLVRATPGLLAYWRLGETAGTVAVDELGFNNGTYTATVGAGTGVAAAPGLLGGEANSAIAFSASQYANLGQSAGVSPSTGSLECWFQSLQPDDGAFHGIAVKANAYSILQVGSHLALFDWGASATRDTGIPVNDGKVHHAVLTFQAGATNGTLVYLDGALVLTTTITSMTHAAVLAVGSVNGTQFFAGTVDEVALYSAILSPAQIAARYSQGAPLSSQAPRPAQLPRRLGPKAVGPTFFAPFYPQVQPIQQPSVPPIWLPPTTFSATRNRSFFAVRGRQVKPLPAQEQPAIWQQPRSARREPARAPRGQRPFPAQPQVPVPPTIPGNRAPALARRLFALAPRGKGKLPVQPQDDPLWPTRTDSLRSKFSMLRRGRQVAPVPAQVPVPKPVFPSRQPAGRRWQSPARGKRSFAMPAQVPVLVAVWPTRVSSLARRLFALQARGAGRLPVQPQTAVPKTPPGNRQPTGRRLATGAKGRQPPLVQPQSSAPAQARARRVWAALRKGRQTSPMPASVAPGVPPPWPPPRLGAARRLLVGMQRGRRGIAPPAADLVAPRPAARARALIRPPARRGFPVGGQDTPVASARARPKAAAPARSWPRPPVPTATGAIVPPTIPGNRSSALARRLLTATRRGWRVIAALVGATPPELGLVTLTDAPAFAVALTEAPMDTAAITDTPAFAVTQTDGASTVALSTASATATLTDRI